MPNENLSKAKAAKNDEFYTQYEDIQREINAYIDYDENTFRDKTVLLPCDDPEWSNFTRFFAQNFEHLGLKKLISTSYAPDSKPADIPYQLTMFEQSSPVYDAQKTRSHGKIFVLTRDSAKRVNLDDLKWSYLEGDGDFRSDEVTALRDEADIVVTNPPFSLFREFMAWLIEGEKKFLIIGNKNCISYKEIFPHLMRNEIWTGCRGVNQDIWFRVPEGQEYEKIEDGVKVKHIMGVWFTNLEHGRHHRPLILMNMADNIKYSKHQEIRGKGYQKYDNYDAIDVPFVDAIPDDYDGLMGVPITFFGSYCPEQYEIVSCANGWGHSPLITRDYPQQQTQIDKKGTIKTVGKLNDGTPIIGFDKKPEDTTCYDVGDGRFYVRTYGRIFIRRKQT